MSVEDNDDDIDEKNKEKMEDKSSKQREEKQDDIDDDGLSTGNLFGPREPEVTAQYPRISGLTISILEKKGLALTLIADHIFSPALALSDAIYTGTLRVFGQRVLELGCGTGLVGLIALVVGDASYVCLTDYDDPSILACPRTNVRLNAGMLSGKKGRCDVVPHTWGTDTANLITYVSSHPQIPSCVHSDKMPSEPFLPFWIGVYRNVHTGICRSINGMHLLTIVVGTDGTI